MKCEMSRVINANYIKYDKLTELIRTAYAGSNINVACIYIDMYSICKSLYNDNVTIEDYSALTSSIINMVAHYRDFFGRINVGTVFFIINSKNHPFFNTQLVSNYNEQNYNTMVVNEKVSDMIDNNEELLNLICKYIKGVYYLNRQSEVSVVAYDIMSKYDLMNKYAHIIISKDIYTWQLVAMKPNTCVLRPKKNNGNDESYVITRDNLMYNYYANKKAKCFDPTISPELLSLLISLTSLPERNIKSACSITKATEYLSNLISTNQIVNGYNSDGLFIFNKIANMSGGKISPFIINNRFKAIDVAYQQLVYMNTSESDYSNELVNLKNKEGIQEINNTYFKSYPLDLNRL